MAKFAACAAATVALMAICAVPAQAAFPGENGRIEFERAEADGSHEIYTIEPDGSDFARLTDTVGSNTSAAWSADGSRIAFTSTRDGRQEIYVMNADGSSQARLTDTAAPEDDPAWSPDGSRIAFSSGTPSGPAILVMNADGSGVEPLIADGHQPDWSPDGDLIAFTRSFDAEDEEVWVAGADGSSPMRLADDGRQPSWSPDASEIAFSGASRFGPVRVMNADGSGQATIGGASGLNPAWSPNGSRIAFHDTEHLSPTQFDILLVSPDGGAFENVTSSASVELSPAWQPLPFKNGSKKCRALPGGHRNHGQCVKANR